MATIRHITQKLASSQLDSSSDLKQQMPKEQKQTQSKWYLLPTAWRSHIEKLYFSVEDAISFQQTSKATFSSMNEIWKPRLDVHFSFDVSRIKRMEARRQGIGKTSINYPSEYKKCAIRDYTSYKDRGNRYRNYTSLPAEDILLLKLFKDGNLKEIKKQNVTLQKLFQVCDSQGRCLIQWAAKNGHQAILDYFFEIALKDYPADTDINHCAGDFNAPRIYWTACFNQVDALKKLLEAKEINVNARNSSGETALHVAAFMGNAVIVDQLISAKAKVNARSQFGRTPFYEATWAGHAYIVTSLLNARADINIGVDNFIYSFLYNNEGPDRTPLMKASERGNYDVASVLLKEAGVQVDSKTNEGNTALWSAVKFSQHEMLPLLIDAKAEVNISKNYTDVDRQTLLHLAADQNDIQSAQLLIDHKANVNVRYGRDTPLSASAFSGYTQMVKTLFKADSLFPHYITQSRANQIFDCKEVKPEIKKIWFTASVADKISRYPSILRFTDFRYINALIELKKAVEDNASPEIFQTIKKRYSIIFKFTEPKNFYNQACEVANSCRAECATESKQTALKRN